MSSIAKKLLIIGSTSYDRNKEGIRIDCVPWANLSGLQNVSDYDLLLVNLLGLRTETERNKVDWGRFQKLFDFVATTDVLNHGGGVVVLGDPRFPFRTGKGKASVRSFTGLVSTSFGRPNLETQFITRSTESTSSQNIGGTSGDGIIH